MVKTEEQMLLLTVFSVTAGACEQQHEQKL
jgi:hypothetical protein